MPYVWGVDSAATVTKDLYQCVLNNFGKPEYWGRYLTRVEGAANGLTRTEIELLHNSGTKILPIYSAFSAAIGTRQGRIVAQNAVFHAKRLGIPKGTPLFANVENFFEVDADWINSYVNTLYNTDYKPGFYHDPDKGGFSVAYCQATASNEKVANQAILWSAEPEAGISKRQEAPAYSPHKPSCKANVWGWQYGRDASACPIDTNLVDQRLYRMLW